MTVVFVFSSYQIFIIYSKIVLYQFFSVFDVVLCIKSYNFCWFNFFSRDVSPELCCKIDTLCRKNEKKKEIGKLNLVIGTMASLSGELNGELSGGLRGEPSGDCKLMEEDQLDLLVSLGAKLVE